MNPLITMKTVLVVDDEPEIVELILLVLGSMPLGCSDIRLLTAYDGEQALEVVQTQHPDLVLTDIMMPRLDGLELCSLIRSDPTTRDIAIVLMTAAYKLDTSGCAADCSMPKPFDITSLVETVHRLLATAA